MIHLTEFDTKKETAVLETGNGKIRITFDDWKRIKEMYESFVGN